MQEFKYDSCSRPDCPEKFPVAMAYVPWQNWTTIYELDKGYKCGTIFPELNRPFTGRRCCK